MRSLLYGGSLRGRTVNFPRTSSRHAKPLLPYSLKITIVPVRFPVGREASIASSLLIIFIGLMLVNASELTHLDGRRSPADYALGCLAALGAVAAWTWYPIMNARHMKANPTIGSSTWSTMQGLTCLPMALAGFAAYGVHAKLTHAAFAFPLGARPGTFIGVMLALGL